MKYILSILGLLLLSHCAAPIEKNEQLLAAIQNPSIEMRGDLVKMTEDDFRFDYYDVSERDSHFRYLDKKGFQGGGYSWEGIVYGAIMLSEPDILNSINFDPEGDGLAIFSKSQSSLEKIGRLIATLKSDNQILEECIAVAKRKRKME